MFNIKSFAQQCIRVWHLLKKPTREEWTTIAKVSAIGLGLIGLIGFIVATVMKLTFLS
ncbi:MAG: protein translocase SEC61 complex subunit gamma [Nanoarchaeota archaeon]|nr:protein translocase SEC61 complex subunit gamma [Nanoarchaeota archaeon]